MLPKKVAVANVADRILDRATVCDAPAVQPAPGEIRIVVFSIGVRSRLAAIVLSVFDGSMFNSTITSVGMKRVSPPGGKSRPSRSGCTLVPPPPGGLVDGVGAGGLGVEIVCAVPTPTSAPGGVVDGVCAGRLGVKIICAIPKLATASTKFYDETQGNRIRTGVRGGGGRLLASTVSTLSQRPVNSSGDREGR